MDRPKKLLSKNGNAKLAKGLIMLGIDTYGLSLSPSTINNSGKDVCPFASAGCRKSCLTFAGMGKWDSVQLARMAKTDYFFSERQKFLDHLLRELTNKAKYAKKQGKEIAVRLNVLSDISFFELLKRFTGVDVLTDEKFSNVKFYDYTKSVKKALKYVNHSRYSLAFSRSENNEEKAMQVLQAGGNVAVVFDLKKGAELPKTYKGYPVIDADESDLVMVGKKSVILGLRLKGHNKEKQDARESGFAVSL